MSETNQLILFIKSCISLFLDESIYPISNTLVGKLKFVLIIIYSSLVHAML